MGKRIPPERAEQVFALRRSGMAFRDIAEQVGMHPETVRSLVERNKVTLPGGILKARRIEVGRRVVAMWNAPSLQEDWEADAVQGSRKLLARMAQVGIFHSDAINWDAVRRAVQP